MPIKVVLAEDSYLVREGVRRLLENEPDIDLVGVYGDYDSLLEAIDSAQPDVLLTDIRMPPSGTNEGVRAAERLRQVRPAAGVVLLSQYADPAYALAFLEGGTEGRAYLLWFMTIEPPLAPERPEYLTMLESFSFTEAGTAREDGS